MIIEGRIVKFQICVGIFYLIILILSYNNIFVEMMKILFVVMVK